MDAYELFVMPSFPPPSGRRHVCVLGSFPRANGPARTGGISSPRRAALTRRRTMHSARRIAASAFTLIELLVVIAIIAILAAILFPVFAQAREQARQTVCISNTRQIGMAVQMYLEDYNET